MTNRSTFKTSTRLAALLAAGAVLLTATGGAYAGSPIARIPTGANTLGGHPNKIQVPPATIPKGPNANNQANAPTQPAPTKPPSSGTCLPLSVSIDLLGAIRPC